MPEFQNHFRKEFFFYSVKKYLFEISDKLAADFVYRGLGRFINLGY